MTYNYPPSGDVSARHIIAMSTSAGGRQIAELHIMAVRSAAVRSTRPITLGVPAQVEGMWN